MSDAITRLTAALEGRYAIEREIGEGGMATVYLAKDLKHNRNVALKVLKPELAAVVGAERFLAEIETTANLQHPHILPLFDSGQADSFLFYVMPYIEGETLRDRIDREKQLPVDEALYIATSVANALQVAHEAGVIHRDIKPGNILLSNGEPLVSDFGIALAVGAAGGNRLTETGLSIGTPYYMSPEQATGDQAIGPASDIYAVACVLFEMLVGEPPYLGNTAQAVLGKIIQGVPVSATAARKAVPANVDAAIRKALEKLPADRFTRAGQFSKALSDHGFRWGEVAGASSGSATRWRGVAIGSGVVAMLALLAAGLGWNGAPAAEPVLRQEIVPIAQSLPRPLGSFTALAPDGSSMVYAEVGSTGGWDLRLKTRASADATLLPGTEGAQNITYSPDSEWIAFVSGNELRKRPIGDGSPVTLAEDLPTPAPTSQIGLAWLDDGTILFELPGPVLMRVPEAGGQADTLMDLSADYLNLAFVGGLPGSRGAFVTVCPGGCGNVEIDFGVVDFEAGTMRVLMRDVVRGWYTPTGHLMYVRRDGAVFAAPFDLDGLDLTGPGIPLFDGVGVTVTSPELAVGLDGTVIYGEGITLESRRELVWVDREGSSERVDPLLGADLSPRTVTLSPGDDRIALTATSDDSGRQLWVKQLPGGPYTRLTNAVGGDTHRPVWTPDEQSLAYITNDGGASHARTIRSDGSSASAFDVLLERERGVFEVLFTSDGSSLLFRESGGDDDTDLFVVDLSADAEAIPLFRSDFSEHSLALSPDENWVAYVSNASGRDEVYVRPYPAADAQTQVSTNGGVSPVWAHNGREIFFIDGEQWITAATYDASTTFAVTDRQRLFSGGGTYFGESGWRMFDVASDDERFLMITVSGAEVQAGQEVPSRVIYIQNFWQELRDRVGG